MNADPRAYHFVGIGGIGMSALARLLLARGAHVTGSDLRTTPLIERLRAEGAQIAIGHRAENLNGANAVIVTSAVDQTNPEVRSAIERGIEVVPRGELLARLAREKRTIAIAGTHGKTTTTAMTARVLEAGGLDPTVAIGGERVDTQTNARAGAGAYFLTESDESDGSFLRLSPTLSVITNIENDHIGSDAELPALLDDFERFARKIPADGCVFVGTDNRYARALAERLGDLAMQTFALHADADLVARDLTFAAFGSRSTIAANGQELGTLELHVPGEINVQNALGAIAVGRELGIDFATIAEALRGFRGVRRRFEILVRSSRFTLVDDYAHHPTAVAETIAAARRYHTGPLVVAFQPHRYTRTAYLAEGFTNALRDADVVYLAPVYAASEPPIPGVSERTIGDPLRDDGRDVRYVAEIDELPATLLAEAPEGALVLMLGAGSVSAVAHRLAGELAATA